MAVRAVLWDLDGVLVDTRALHMQAWRQLVQELALPWDERYFQRTFGQRNDAILGGLLPDRPADALLALGRRKEAIVRSLMKGRVRPLPGVDDLVRRLHDAGRGQAIVSSTPRQNIDLILQSTGLAAYFDAIVGEEDVRRGKPDPEVLLIAARLLGVTADVCVVIEDAPAGIEAAVRAGMRSIGVATTRPPAELSRADLVVDSLSDTRVTAFLGVPHNSQPRIA